MACFGPEPRTCPFTVPAVFPVDFLRTVATPIRMDQSKEGCEAMKRKQRWCLPRAPAAPSPYPIFLAPVGSLLTCPALLFPAGSLPLLHGLWPLWSDGHDSDVPLPGLSHIADCCCPLLHLAPYQWSFISMPHVFPKCPLALHPWAVVLQCMSWPWYHWEFACDAVLTGWIASPTQWTRTWANSGI